MALSGAWVHYLCAFFFGLKGLHGSLFARRAGPELDREMFPGHFVGGL